MDFIEIAKRVDDISKNVALMDEEELNMKLDDICRNLELLEAKNETDKLNIEDMSRTIKDLKEIISYTNRIKARMKSIERPVNYTKIGNN